MEGIATLFKALDTEIIALVLTLPRIHAFLSSSQLFTQTTMGRLARTCAIIVLAVPVVPVNMALAETFDRSVLSYALFFAKEYAIGFLLGYLIAWLFWAVSSAAALIDNQRGAAIASSIDPLQGHETSPLGILFSQAFLTYIFTTGAFLIILNILYGSYLAWPVDRFVPILAERFPVFMLAVMDNSMRLMFVLAAPIVAVMFLAEFALALVSRFAPQIQVFILAMPIKSGLAIFMLIFYFGTLLPYAESQKATFYNYTNELYQMLRFGETIPWPPPPQTPPPSRPVP